MPIPAWLTILRYPIVRLTDSATKCPSRQVGTTFLEQSSDNLGRINSSTGILTCYPSTTPFGLALGSTNPEMINIAQETLGFRRAGFSPALLRYSCQHSHFCTLHPTLRRNFTAEQNALLPLCYIAKSVASVSSLSPGKFSAQIYIDQ